MLMYGDGNMSVTYMFRHSVSGLCVARLETFSMLRQTLLRVRPGGLTTSRLVLTVTLLAFKVRLLKFGRLLIAASSRG
jgi:hypothetical protein